MKKLILASAVVGALGAVASTSAHAALAGDAVLAFDPGVPGGPYNFIQSGSYFAMDNNSDGVFLPGERTGLTASNGLALGTTQAAGDIDVTWSFFSNNGNHFTDIATTVSNAAGNTADVNMTGWSVFWNNIDIPMGSGTSNGVGSVVCGVDCATGDTFTLDYLATVPDGDPSGFGNVDYQLHLEGSVAAGGGGPVIPIPAAVWLFGSGLLGLVGVARRRKAA